MPLVCLTSPKGGVGRTTLAASLGVALRRLGWRVLLLDLDRQNALRLNFELPEELRGIADELESGRDWAEFAVETPAGVQLVPFGAATAGDGLRANAFFAANPGWLRQRLTPLMAQRDLLVVADTPTAPTALDLELEPISDLQLMVLLADAMSLALLPRLQRGEYRLASDEGAGRLGYVLNQVDPRRQLCRDVLALSRDVLGEAIYGMVHQDEAVAEAAACQLTVLDYASDSVASQDILALARRVHSGLAPV